MDKQFSNFLEVFKKLHINIPFVDALEQIPSYAKFMKEILSNKWKLEENEIVALTKEYSAIFQHKLPPKQRDPESFNILCTIGNSHFDRPLCDLRANINLMAFLVYKKLELGDTKPTMFHCNQRIDQSNVWNLSLKMYLSRLTNLEEPVYSYYSWSTF